MEDRRACQPVPLDGLDGADRWLVTAPAVHDRTTTRCLSSVVAGWVALGVHVEPRPRAGDGPLCRSRRWGGGSETDRPQGGRGGSCVVARRLPDRLRLPSARRG